MGLFLLFELSFQLTHVVLELVQFVCSPAEFLGAALDQRNELGDALIAIA
jgi:hypothetical protein